MQGSQFCLFVSDVQFVALKLSLGQAAPSPALSGHYELCSSIVKHHPHTRCWRSLRPVHMLPPDFVPCGEAEGLEFVPADQRESVLVGLMQRELLRATGTVSAAHGHQQSWSCNAPQVQTLLGAQGASQLGAACSTGTAGNIRVCALAAPGGSLSRSQLSFRYVAALKLVCPVLLGRCCVCWFIVKATWSYV